MSKHQNDEGRQAAFARREEQGCAAVVCGTGRPSGEGSTAYSRHRRTSGRWWIQPGHLKAEETGLPSVTVMPPSRGSLALQVTLLV